MGRLIGATPPRRLRRERHIPMLETSYQFHSLCERHIVRRIKFYSPSNPVGNPEEGILPTILEIPELESFSIFAPNLNARTSDFSNFAPPSQPSEPSSPPRIDISPPPADPIDPEPEVEAIAPPLIDPPSTVPLVVPDSPAQSQGHVRYDLHPRDNRRSFAGMIAGKFDSLVDSPPNTIAEALHCPD